MLSRFVFLVFLLSLQVHLQAQIATDRPDQTEASSTVPKGALQIEVGALLAYSGEGSASIRQILLPTNLFRFGISEAVKLRFLSQFEALKIGEFKNSGISDIEIGTKF